MILISLLSFTILKITPNYVCDKNCVDFCLGNILEINKVVSKWFCSWKKISFWKNLERVLWENFPQNWGYTNSSFRVWSTVWLKGRYLDGSSGLVVMGGELKCEGREFESHHGELDRHFFTLICCKICSLFGKDWK